MRSEPYDPEAHQRRLAALQAEIAATMAAEGFQRGRVDEVDPKAVAECVFWCWTAYTDREPGYVRKRITGKGKPSWSRHFSLYAGSERAALAKGDETLWWRGTR